MRSIARYELLAVAFLAGLLLVSIIPSLKYARQEQRDGIRRHEVRAHKRALEMYFNEHEKYPVQYDASPHVYIVEDSDGEQALKWYVRAELENRLPETAQFDEEYNMYYRVVREGERTFYDICGGTSDCGAER